jgi:hypothetical protein
MYYATPPALMCIHGTRDRATQSPSKPHLNYLKVGKEKPTERVKCQSGLTLCCSPRFFDLYGAVLIPKIGVILIASIACIVNRVS